MPRSIRTCAFPHFPLDIPDAAVVVTPHGPAADALRRTNVSLQDLARRALAKRSIFAAEPRVAAKLLREAIREVSPLSDASAISRRISEVLKTILRVGIDTEELLRCGSGRAGELARIAQAFRGKLREKGLVHREELVWQAANLSDIEPQVLYIYGYTRGRSEEIAFIDRFAAEGSIYYLPIVGGADAFSRNADYAAQLETRGWSMDDREYSAGTIGERAAAKLVGISEKVASQASAHSLHDVDGEVRYVLGEVKKLLRAGTPASEIAVAVRDLDLYAKEFALVGAEYMVPTVSSLKIPISETLVGGFVSLLLSVVENDFAFEETARLLGHPLGPGMSDETWRRSRRDRTDNYYQWLSIEDALGCLEDFRDGRTRSASEWVNCLRAIFARFEVRKRAGRSARETVAYNCLQDELAFLADEAEPMSFLDLALAVRDILANVRTAFDPSRMGVSITEPHRIAGGRFRHVFALGLAEGVFPALPSDNPVIDFHERRFLAKEGIDFEEAADIPRWEELSFFSLLSTATESLTLTYPKTIGKDAKIRSSFFGKLELNPVPAEPSILCSHSELVRNTLRKKFDPVDPIHAAAVRQLKIELRRESSDPHDDYDGVTGEPIDVAGRKWSVSQLTALAGCGFRWFARYGLGINPPDEMEIEISPAALGKLFHYALDFPVSQGQAKTREEVIHLLDHALASGYHSRDVAMPRVPNWDLRRAEYVDRLTRAVNAADFLPERSEIAATEQEFEVTIHDLKIRGRIDRIDRTPNGLTAVDYKNGGKKPDSVCDREGRKLDLQIAVYLAALRSLYPREKVAGGFYYSLSSRKSFAADTAEEIVLKEFLEGILEAPRTGSLPVRPISAKACTYCDYDQLCRTGSRIVRKEAALNE